ncbi:MAG TPA: hypothetical protein GX707_00140 [Epulopiscium sp.]|nr:hypothetical protein [Candidatus Epulonipiscium sp.]
MTITEETIPLIEKALNVKLYEPQKRYLLGFKAGYGMDRGVGRTFAHCIYLALSDGKDFVVTDDRYGKVHIRGNDPIDARKMERYSDYGDGSLRYANRFFKRMFLEIWEQLKSAGLPVREVRF